MAGDEGLLTEIMYVYILKSIKTKRFYIGHCRNIGQRLKLHNVGMTKSTKAGIPWEVIYYEEFESRAQAVRREKLIKSYKGGNAFKKLIGGVA